MTPLLPRYGAGALADVVPSLLAGLDVPGTSDVLGLPAASRVCLLLVDGLGWELLHAHRADAPFLAGLAADSRPITAGFPATTATSVASVGTGAPAGEHGVVGLSFAVGEAELLNALGWQRHGIRRTVDLRDRVVPEDFQPRPTAFQRAADAGVAVRLVAPRELKGSGLSRAVLRGGEYRGVHALGDLTSVTLDALGAADRVFCYAYHADLDLLGHIYGPGSAPWRRQLAYVDQLAAMLAAGLPRGGLLVTTADHGMIGVDESDRVDFDTEPALRDGVRMLGGEPRARYVYTRAGATDDVRAAWQATLGDGVWLLGRDEAIEAGWFGPRVSGATRARIGDLVVAARGSLVVTRSRVEPRLSRFRGQHGSLTAEEQLIPLLVSGPTG